MSAQIKGNGRRAAARPKITKQCMSDEAFGELVESLNYALQYERGKREGFRVTVIPKPPKDRTMRDIVKIRDVSMSLNQFSLESLMSAPRPSRLGNKA